MGVEDVANMQGTLGRLHPVGKCRKEFICRECKEEFPVGSPCYNQADHRQEGFFPEQTKVCMECGKNQIENGIEVKIKKPTVKKKGIGCGEDTLYPKPDNQGFWKCGEKAPLIGEMLCCKCIIAKGVKA